MKKAFSRLRRKPKGMRWPRSRSAMTRKVRPPAVALLLLVG